jgi:hypothetical protein
MDVAFALKVLQSSKTTDLIFNIAGVLTKGLDRINGITSCNVILRERYRHLCSKVSTLCQGTIDYIGVYKCRPVCDERLRKAIFDELNNNIGSLDINDVTKFPQIIDFFKETGNLD